MFNAFDLMAVLTLDSSGYDKGLDDASESAKGMGSKIGGALKTVGKVSAGAIAAGGAAVGALTKQAVSAYGEYEQLKGGVETLFGAQGMSIEEYADSVGKSIDEVKNEYNSLLQAQSTVLGNADRAFETAGLSVNEYISTVTGFAAALNASVGGDTEKAAQMADMAITDMSDNANKMGSSMESIQNAYSGFAKQNYTMLDNLKLGYGGTKEEMERLLADAERLSGQKFDVSSYADIVEAIHVVQTEMGITGTTAKEASETIQGSLGMTKSAWQNLIAGLGNSDADLEQLIDNFVNSLDKLGDNIFPIIEKVLDGIGKLVEKFIPKIANKLPGWIQKIFPKLLNAVTKLIVSLANNLPQLIQTLLPPLLSALIQVGAAIIQNLPAILGSIFEALLTTLFELFASLGENLAEPVMALIDGLVGFFSTAWDAIVGIFSGIGDWFTGLWENVKEVFAGVGEFFSGIFSDAWDAITGVFSAIGDWFEERWKDIKKVFSGISGFFRTVFEGARDAIRTVWNTVTSLIKTPINALIGLLNVFIRGLNKIKVPDWVPGIGGYGIHIPEIPELAEGGILKKGQMGLLEGNGTEAVVPLDQNKKWVASIVAEMRKQGGGMTGDIVIPVSIGQRRIETIVIEAQRLNQYRSGGR